MNEINIVILTKNFGYNFTGATVATHELIQKWSRYKEVDGITVLTLNVGEYRSVSKLHVIKLKNHRQLKKSAFHLRRKNTIFYSDDHLGYLLNGLPYVHTYHGNWPEARLISLEMFLKSFYFINRYGKTIRHASVVVNVSRYMKKFTDTFNKRTVVIRNGVSIRTKVRKDPSFRKKVLMIGTLEPRKYGRLVELLKVLPDIIHIDAYGNIKDKKLVEELNQYSNFTAKGFVNFREIPLEQYDCFLSLSKIENMPISLVEVLNSGIPAVAYAVGGIHEIVNDNCGVLFTKQVDMKKIAKTLQDIVSGERTFSMSNPELSTFDWDISSIEYLRVFKNVLESAGQKL